MNIVYAPYSEYVSFAQASDQNFSPSSALALVDGGCGASEIITPYSDTVVN